MEQSHSFGPIRLAPGVLPRHVFAYLFAAFVSIGMFTYLIALTPYILNVNLGLPEDQQGQISGDLQFWQEIVLLGVIGWWGAISDRVGRRVVYIAGFAILAVAYVSYGFATSTLQLTGFRLIFAMGVAATTTSLAAVLADYAHEDSRGKLTGISFFLNGLGSVIFFIGLLQLPQFFAGRGIDEIWAGRYAMMIAGGIALTAAAVMFGLKPGRAIETIDRPSVARLMGEGVLAARNPRIAIAYVSAFAARADMAILTLFLTLWVVQAVIAGGGTATEAAARAGMVGGIAQIAAVIWAPIFGIVGDKIDRLTLLVVAFLISTIGYGWVASTDDILSMSAIPALLCLGAGLSSAQLGSTVLLAQESPAGVRGSTFGVQSFCGAIGILVLSAGGGRLFDSIGPQAPFVAVATANGVVLALAVVRRAIELRGVPTTAAAVETD